MAEKRKWYAVSVGRVKAIFTSWLLAEKSVHGYHGCAHKRYESFEEAKLAMIEAGIPNPKVIDSAALYEEELDKQPTQPTPDADLEAVFNKLTTEESGAGNIKVETKEFKEETRKVEEPDEQERNRMAFRVFVIDKDGILGKVELRRILKNMQFILDDGDEEGTVDYEEFVKVWNKASAKK